MNKLVEEAPYHPGYEDAVVSPAQKYKGVDPAKMIWNNNELLRQQADRIAELEKVSSKPVAWGIRDKDGNIYDCICPEEHDRHEGLYTVPLYATPQTKPLSDDEILQIYSEIDGAGIIEFARALEKRHGIK